MLQAKCEYTSAARIAAEVFSTCGKRASWKKFAWKTFTETLQISSHVNYHAIEVRGLLGESAKYCMQRKTRSILEELDKMVQERDRVHVLESRGQNIIDSAIRLIQSFHENYNQATAADLEKRLLNSIRTQDPKKFKRGIMKVNR